jgi:MFS family permease
MNGIHTIFRDTPMTETFGLVLAYATAVFFIVLLIKNGVLRSVLTDNGSWSAVYGVAFLLTIGAIIHSRGSMNILSWGIEPVGMADGFQKMILLIPGPFLYPYYYKLLDHNDSNDQGIRKINIRKSFILGGLLFGAYLTFTFLLAWTHFSPVLNIIKAFLIFVIATSTVSSFLFSIYITFGRKFGLAVNIATVGLWQLLIPLGVMGMWTLMASIRIYIVGAGILAALAWHFIEKRRKAVRP